MRSASLERSLRTICGRLPAGGRVLHGRSARRLAGSASSIARHDSRERSDSAAVWHGARGIDRAALVGTSTCRRRSNAYANRYPASCSKSQRSASRRGAAMHADDNRCHGDEQDYSSITLLASRRDMHAPCAMSARSSASRPRAQHDRTRTSKVLHVPASSCRVPADPSRKRAYACRPAQPNLPSSSHARPGAASPFARANSCIGASLRSNGNARSDALRLDIWSPQLLIRDPANRWPHAPRCSPRSTGRDAGRPAHARASTS